jgi:hypothetical protein
MGEGKGASGRNPTARQLKVWYNFERRKHQAGTGKQCSQVGLVCRNTSHQWDVTHSNATLRAGTPQHAAYIRNISTLPHEGYIPCQHVQRKVTGYLRVILGKVFGVILHILYSIRQ